MMRVPDSLVLSLNFQCHILNIAKKILKQVAFFLKSDSVLCTSICLGNALLLDHLSLSHLWYLCLGFYYPKLYLTLITKHKSAIRTVTNLQNRQHSAPLHKSLNILNIKSLHILTSFLEL